MTTSVRIKSLFERLCSLPVLGLIIKVTNSHAFHGDVRSDRQFAGWGRWIKAFGPELCISIALTFLTNWEYVFKSIVTSQLQPCATGFSCNPGALLTSILPSILGFGIGVYALIFALTPVFVKNAQLRIKAQVEANERDFGSVLMINADLAFPLIALILSLACAVVQQLVPQSVPVIFITWVATWFSITQILALVTVIHGLADGSLIEKAK